jgi:adhesin transport system outer membrane protein
VPPAIDPQLARAAELAISRYPSMKAANALVRATEQDVRAAIWLQGPSASISAVTRESRIEPQLEIFQPLWAGGRIGASIDRAEATREVSQAEVGVTAFDILVRVSRAYYGVVRGIRIGAILDDSLAEHQRLVESMERRVTQEVSPRSDLDLARSRAAQVRQELSLTTAQRYAALQQLRELVGDPDFEVNPLPVYDKARHHPTSDDLVQAALTCDPGIRRLRAETGVAEADRKLARAALFPQVGLQFTHNRFQGSGLGVAVQANTNGGLSPVAAANAAAARTNAARFRVTVAERETREATILDIVENTAAAAQVEASKDAATSSSSVTDSFMRQFITGRRTWLDVMNAVRESNAARIALTNAEISAMSSSARLLIRSCQWQAHEIRAGSAR